MLGCHLHLHIFHGREKYERIYRVDLFVQCGVCCAVGLFLDMFHFVLNFNSLYGIETKPGRDGLLAIAIPRTQKINSYIAGSFCDVTGGVFVALNRF